MTTSEFQQVMQDTANNLTVISEVTKVDVIESREVVSLNADLSGALAELANKANKSDLLPIYASVTTINADITSLNAGLNSKASTTYVDAADTAINNHLSQVDLTLANKADKTELSPLFAGITSINTSISDININLNSKASRTELTNSIATVNTSIQSVASDLSNTNTEVSTVKSTLASKVNKTDYDNTVALVNAVVIDNQAQQQSINRVETNKADKTELTAHIVNRDLHVPAFATYSGMVLSNDGTKLVWTNQQGGGGVALPINISDVRDLQSTLNSKAPSTDISSINIHIGSIDALIGGIDTRTTNNESALLTQATNLTNHIQDAVKHITDLERTTWNGKSNFDGNYNSLTNKPTLSTVAISGIYGDLLNPPDLTSLHTHANKTDLDAYNPANFAGVSHNHNLANLAEKSYNSLSDKPTLFSGSYNDLTNKPSIPVIANPTTLTDLTIDGAVYNFFVSTITANASFTLSNIATNQIYYVVIKNNSASTITITLPNTADIKAAATSTISAGKYREFSFYYNGTSRFWQISEEIA